jgi:DNA-binding transcriptional LysR family regulator
MTQRLPLKLPLLHQYQLRWHAAVAAAVAAGWQIRCFDTAVVTSPPAPALLPLQHPPTLPQLHCCWHKQQEHQQQQHQQMVLHSSWRLTGR